MEKKPSTNKTSLRGRQKDRTKQSDKDVIPAQAGIQKLGPRFAGLAKTRWRVALVLVAALLFPILDRNPYHIDVLVTAGIFIMLALGLNVIVGSAGILNLGYAALFAVGAYTYALLNIHGRVPFWIGLPLSAVSAAVFGMILAFPALRLTGDYIAIVTLGAGEIVRIILNNADRVTGGPNGLLGIDHPSFWVPRFDFGVRSEPYYYLNLILIVLAVAGLRRLELSRLGRAWNALREDELAASCMGINPVWAKLSAFGIGGFVAGIAGCVFAGKQGTISPDSFDFIVSVMIASMVVLGGMGNIGGVILGAFILSLLPELLRGFEIYRMLIFGVAMILIMLFRPQGLLGEIRHKGELAEREER
ncbi:MAG: branched-chain amino acid ABC transporter permease [Candidatus Omnitrophica bacterium]|nr:branched-chain amino acid ABC transporter permease [Candidatus Omnitrophota bacterium]